MVGRLHGESDAYGQDHESLNQEVNLNGIRFMRNDRVVKSKQEMSAPLLLK